MTTRTMNGAQRSVMLALLVALSASGMAFGQARGRGTSGPRAAPPAHQHFDAHFGHNRYYYDRGYSVRQPPRGGYAMDRGRDRYWYDGGQWYRRGTLGWVVAGPPIGAFVSELPPFYTTVWFGGAPYYYANDTYYVWNGGQQQYEVAQPPADIDTAGTTQPPASDTIFVYPKNGQSSEQQTNDRYQCHQSAIEQSGYDPTKAGGGVPPEVAAGKRADYLRAESACLDARGYRVG